MSSSCSCNCSIYSNWIWCSLFSIGSICFCVEYNIIPFNGMDTNSLIHRVKDHSRDSRRYCMDMGMDMVHNSSLDNSYLRIAALDDDDDNGDNCMDHMDVVGVGAGADKDDLDRFVVELWHAAWLLVLDDKQTTAEIHEYVAVVLDSMNFVRVKLCLVLPLDSLRLNFLALIHFDCYPLQMSNFLHRMDLNRVKI